MCIIDYKYYGTTCSKTKRTTKRTVCGLPKKRKKKPTFSLKHYIEKEKSMLPEICNRACVPFDSYSFVVCGAKGNEYSNGWKTN